MITGKAKIVKQRPRQSRRARPSGRSPDGKWRAFVKNDNVYIEAVSGGTEIPLSRDGRGDNRYAMLQWSGDSRSLVAFRVEPGERKDVHTIESSPRQGGRARLRSRPYPLPGDKFTSYELNVFDIVGKKQIKPKVDPINFGRPRIRWIRDGRRFTYEKTDRGHQRFRVIEVDPHTGAARNLIDEKAKTFILTSYSRVGRS